MKVICEHAEKCRDKMCRHIEPHEPYGDSIMSCLDNDFCLTICRQAQCIPVDRAEDEDK